MTELKVNLQGSWKRILAMITVAAMCFTVIYVSPVSAAAVDATGDAVTVVTGAETTPDEVTVSPSNVTLTAADATAQLSGTVKVTADEVAVTWESNNDAVTVDANGVVKAVSKGTAVITLKAVVSGAEAALTDTCEVTAEWDDPQVPVESVKLDKSALNLEVGKTGVLKATVNPSTATNKVVTWTTSDPKIAEVKDGTVTAKAAGKATITAKAGDKTATCAVTVTAPANNNNQNNNNTTGTVAPKVGEQKVVSGVTYKVAKNNTVTYQKPKKNAKKVTVPATVKINGKTYKVTSVANNAFKGNKKVKTVTVGKNVTTIGAGAFQNCKALTKVTLPAKAKTIGKNAFANSKKLKTIVIKSTKMTKKTIKNGAFKKVSKKVTVDVPNKKAKTYKKLFQKKGLPKACKVK